jgi:hypothetical protein
MFDDMDMDVSMPGWASDMHKSMEQMHKRMMGWMKKSFESDTGNIGNIFADLKNDMSELKANLALKGNYL